MNRNITNITKKTFLIIVFAFFHDSSFHLDVISKEAEYIKARMITTHNNQPNTFQNPAIKLVHFSAKSDFCAI
jgi:hypothetical protein